MASEPTYYRPFYSSDSDEDSALSEDDIDFTPPNIPRPLNAEPEEAGPDFSTFARQLNEPIKLASGPDLETETKQIEYGLNNITKNIVYGPILDAKDAPPLNITAQAIDNVIILESLNRDFRLYVQPTQCQLMLPREYRAVSSFEIVEIAFNTSFFYFRQDKSNISIQISEQHRLLYDSTLNPTISTPLIITANIRPGSYSIVDLLTELSIQLNTPALFYDFLNGFTDFYNIFISTGDFSLNFNYPGDYYYDSLQKTYISSPTREIICSYYFEGRYATTSVIGTYTIDQVRVAYYYPVIKEYLLDPRTDVKEYSIYIDTTRYNNILYNFTGLNDINVSNSISNLTFRRILDRYRLLHTFRYSLVNAYSLTYNAQNNLVCIKSNTLNSSLVSLLQTQYNVILQNTISRSGFTSVTYAAQIATVNALHAILVDMYNIIQNATYNAFGISVGEYDIEYYSILDNFLLLRNGLNPSSVTQDYNSSLPALISTNINASFRLPTTSYWAGMTNIPSATLTSLNEGINNHPYDIETISTIGGAFIDSTGDIYTDNVKTSGDIIVKVPAGKYAIFQFRSKFRQTVQVEVLPKPEILQYAEWNSANLLPPNNTIFSTPYINIYPNGNGSLIQTTSQVSITQIPIANFVSLQNPNILYSNGTDFRIDTNKRFGAGFSFTAPIPANITATTKVKYPMNIAIIPGNGVSTNNISVSSGSINFVNTNADIPIIFADDCILFLYHSEAAYYADVGPSGALNENPTFYKYKQIIPNGSSIINFTYNVYGGETYYILFRPQSDVFSNINFRILPFIDTNVNILRLTTELSLYTNDPNYFDPTSPTFDYTRYLSSSFVIARVHDPDWIQLPISTIQVTSSLPMIAADVSSGTNPSELDINIGISTIIPVLGYDIHKISNDATDYIPVSTSLTSILVDPINSYTFNKASPYNPLTNSYDVGVASSKNFITDINNRTYTWNSSGVTGTVKIMNTNVTTYISTSSALVNGIPPYTSSITLGSIGGYSYDAGGNILLGSGPCGFTFIPGEGKWTVKSITFKGQTSNTAVELLGVFPSSEVYTINPLTIASTILKASALCALSSSNTYNSTNLRSGFDSTHGTYYTYSSIINTATLHGYTESPSISILDPESYVSVVSFGAINGSLGSIRSISDVMNKLSNIKIVSMENLAGSPIAYPFSYSTISSPTFYDGTTSINGRSIVISGNQTQSNYASLLPTSNLRYDKSVSVYEQSTPIVNSHLHFINTENFITNLSALSVWTNVPIEPVDIIATIPGFLLVKGAFYTILSYKRGSNNFISGVSLSEDLIFPPSEGTKLLSMSGNSSHYVFLGVNTLTQAIRIKMYNPKTNILNEENLNRIQDNNLLVYNLSTFRIGDFVYSDASTWWISYAQGTSTILLGVYKISLNGYKAISVSFNSTVRTFLALDPVSSVLYYASTNSGGFTSMKTYITDQTLYFNTFPPNPASDINIALSGGPYIKMSAGGGIVYLINGITLNFTIYNESTVPTISTSSQVLPSSPINISSGPNACFWTIFATEPFIMGHPYPLDFVDLACQIFFPTMKIELNKLTNFYTPITDLTNIQTPEWQHTALFAYSTFTSFSNDILTSNWGMESNYMSCDTQFSGYEFNAYIQNIQTFSNWTSNAITSNAENAYYIALRGYSPTEDFNALLRWKVPNRTDFGYVSISTIVNEISSIKNPSSFNPTYLTALSTFNSAFILPNNLYGFSIVSGLSGSTINTTGFKDFIINYSTIYSQFSYAQNQISTINTLVTSQMNTYISSNFKYILPSSLLNRNRYTDPVSFSLQWSTLTAASDNIYSSSVSEWGLGWNLGYSKSDTPYRTVHYADSLFKIQDEYIYLRLNPEFNINRLDTGSKENYYDSREPSGIVQQYYCKLLLNGFGNKATTFTHNPVLMNPTLPRLSKVNFEWTDSKGNILTNLSATDSDWSMTVHIQEQVKTFNFESLNSNTILNTLKSVSGSAGQSLAKTEAAFSTLTSIRS
jgi:hypothetical protein